MLRSLNGVIVSTLVRKGDPRLKSRLRQKHIFKLSLHMVPLTPEFVVYVFTV